MNSQHSGLSLGDVARIKHEKKKNKHQDSVLESTEEVFFDDQSYSVQANDTRSNVIQLIFEP